MQIINIWSEVKPIPKVYFYGFNIVFLIVAGLIGLFNLSPSIVIAYDGAICGFLIVFVIPVYLYFKTIKRVDDRLIKYDVQNSSQINKND